MPFGKMIVYIFLTFKLFSTYFTLLCIMSWMVFTMFYFTPVMQFLNPYLKILI